MCASFEVALCSSPFRERATDPPGPLCAAIHFRPSLAPLDEASFPAEVSCGIEPLCQRTQGRAEAGRLALTPPCCSKHGQMGHSCSLCSVIYMFVSTVNKKKNRTLQLLLKRSSSFQSLLREQCGISSFVLSFCPGSLPLGPQH